MEKEPIYEKSKEIAKKYLGIDIKTKLDDQGVKYGTISEPDFDMLADYLNRDGKDSEYVEYLLGNRLDRRD